MPYTTDCKQFTDTLHVSQKQCADIDRRVIHEHMKREKRRKEAAARKREQAAMHKNN